MIKIEHTKTHELPLQLLPTMHGLVATRPRTTTLVTEAKLVLVEIGMDGDYPDYKSGIIGVNHNWYKPILISETEKIEVGDLIYWKHNKSIQKVKSIDVKNNTIDFDDPKYNGYLSACYKILALPEHFSPLQLQMIVDGKLKDGDTVLVGCDTLESLPPQYCIQLNPHITIYPVEEKMYTREEVWKITNTVSDGFLMRGWSYMSMKKWFEQNVK